MRGTLQAYKKVSVDSQLDAASPHRIIQMLLAGAIERLIQGKAAMQAGNTAQKGERLGKTIDILTNLKASLTRETPEAEAIANNLDGLYDYMIRQVFDANVNNETAGLDTVIELLRELKSSWDQIPAELHHIGAE
ncbi:MAG: flagellar export chaperone FliS [Plesiomonas sp.]|nr:flagellar export chaperone FliS [Plesiomonas sp.]